MNIGSGFVLGTKHRNDIQAEQNLLNKINLVGIKDIILGKQSSHVIGILLLGGARIAKFIG